MISFHCPGCGRHFIVPDERAGQQGRCKGCGTSLCVPPPPPAEQGQQKIVINFDDCSLVGGRQAGSVMPPPPTAQTARRQSVRTRRLVADARIVREIFKNFSPIQIMEMIGDPPDVYRIRYQVTGLEPGPDGDPIPRHEHIAEIQLTREYPRQAPKCKMLTPIFHPNIEPGMICVGDHWTAGERLADLIIRIGQMIAYQAYNIKSPLDGEAAMWADLHQKELPVDSTDLYPPGY